MIVVLTAATLVNLVVNTLLPMLVALVTARNAHPGLKALVLLVASIISGVLTTWLQAQHTGIPFDLAHTLLMIAEGWAVAILTHYGLLKPTKVTGSNGAIQLQLPGGLGDSKLSR